MKNIHFILLSFLFAFGITSCVDNVIDEPPVKEAPSIETNATIADLKAKLVLGQIVEITEDLVIDAVISADDESGNFYKNVIIQDETGGIAVRIEANNLYTVLPVGREIFLKAKGLFIGDYNNLPQLGYGNDDGNLLTIPFTFVDSESESALIIPARRDQPVVANVVSINTLGNAAINTLIQLDDVQFLNGELGQTYADAINQFSENRTIEDCDGNTIVVRTSGFSDFAGTPVAEGKGSLTAIYSIFGDTKQLSIRNTEDVALSGDRCGDIGNPDTPVPNATIADVMALFTEGSVNQITSDLIFDAVMISSDETGNFFKQLIMQDETGGINIRVDDFDLFNNFNLGRKVVVKAKDLYIGDFNGLPQLGALFNGEVGRIATGDYPNHIFKSDNGSQVTPANITIDNVDASMLNTLVTISNSEFIDAELGTTYASPGGGFAVNKTIQDCDENTILLRNSDFADFAGFNVPDGNGSITGVLGVFGTDYQLFIRKIQDVNMTGTRCDGGGSGGTVIFEEDFESLEPNLPTAPAGWTNQNTMGSEVWESREFGDNKYLIASAFEAAEDVQECWLVTPAIEMTGTNVMTLESATSFWVHDGLTVLISNDFTGDATTATWTELNVSLASSGSDNWTFETSGNIDLSSYSGMHNIAFKYEGTESGNTSNYLLDNISITE